MLFYSPNQDGAQTPAARAPRPPHLGRTSSGRRTEAHPRPPAPDAAHRLYCTCAPVWDYTGQEVARVGLFGHGADDRPILTDHHRGVWELARRISLRLGYLPPALETSA